MSARSIRRLVEPCVRPVSSPFLVARDAALFWDSPIITPTHNTIAISAYFDWEAEGRPNGRHEIRWLTAKAALERAAASVAAKAASIKAPAPAKAPAVRKTAAKKPAIAKAKAPSAPAETVVAAAALAVPRAARVATKGASRTH